MKSCGCCGQLSPETSSCCAGCGTELKAATDEGTSSSPSIRRPPRPEAASIVLRTFDREAAAHEAVELLRTARIEAFIATDDCGGLYPPLNAGSPFRLVISEVHQDAAEQVLAESAGQMAPVKDLEPNIEPANPSITPNSSAFPSTTRVLAVFALGIVTGMLALVGYQKSQRVFTGTVQRDFNYDGRTDGWETYQKGKLSKTAANRNGDEQPDAWYYFEDGVVTKWEEDWNFDGRIDFWAAFDSKGIISQSKLDSDFDGNPDVSFIYEFGLLKESHSILSESGLLWKKDFYTNGLLREVLLDRDRDGKFDERLSFNVFGVEVKKESVD
jgi:hypothetical protein